ncbi:MAG: hypothetical protein ACREOO_21820 [bacterium]
MLNAGEVALEAVASSSPENATDMGVVVVDRQKTAALAALFPLEVRLSLLAAWRFKESLKNRIYVQ